MRFRQCDARPVCRQVLLPGFLTALWHPAGDGHGLLLLPCLSALEGGNCSSHLIYLCPTHRGSFAKTQRAEPLKQITVAVLTPSLHVACKVCVRARKRGINSRVVVRSVCSCVNELSELLEIICRCSLSTVPLQRRLGNDLCRMFGGADVNSLQ